MSLTSTRYTGWGDFRTRFDYAFRPVVEIFGIEEFQRIGLRYINAVRPSSIGITDMRDLLKPPYTELLDTNLGSARGMSSVFDYGLPDGISGRSAICMIRFIDGETGILIDDDAFIEGHIKREKIIPRMDRLNEASLSAFTKIASDKLLSKVMRWRHRHTGRPYFTASPTSERPDTIRSIATASMRHP